MVDSNPFDRSATRQEIPLLPLKDLTVFPHMIVPVFLNETLCINAVKAALARDSKIFLSAFQVPAADDSGLRSSIQPPFDVYKIGTVCAVMRTRILPDGRMKVVVQGLTRSEIVEVKLVNDIPMALVLPCADKKNSASQAECEAMLRIIKEGLEKIVSLGKILSPEILMILEDIADPSRMADIVASNLGLKVEDAQSVLALSDPLERLKKVHFFLSKEIEVFKMQVKIQNHAREEFDKFQKEQFLREQIKALRTELGDTQPKDEYAQFWQKLSTLKISGAAGEEISRQLKRLERMHPESSEAALCRNFIDTAFGLPWLDKTEDCLNLTYVAEVLEKDHYGLQVVKDRILEYLAVKKLNPSAKGPILCFVGPPGVGKTSLGRSIANAMGRKFYRISLGGVRDEAEIRGHRRTYIGALPGRIISGIGRALSSNPVIMLDEIDKLGTDYRGDPAAALLEVLDPEQNNSFVDHYLGFPFDLSQVLFIANANSLATIPPALHDRLEVIEVSGYSEQEKFSIARRFLVPKQVQEAGLTNAQINFSDDGLLQVIRGYTRESGLRNLEKQISSICRKIARKVAENLGTQVQRAWAVTGEMVQELLGTKKYESTSPYRLPTIGVALGLAYTKFGGELLPIEVSLLPGNNALVLTGHLGNIMKESAQAALSFIRSNGEKLGLDAKIFNDYEIHVHFPQSAIPKDGPSAGVALVTAILSALRRQAPRALCCMTGEITILGQVLPVGGLKEKLLAARREGINNVVLPQKNQAEVLAMPETMREGMHFFFVDNYFSASEILYPLSGEKVTSIKNRGENLPILPTNLAG
jgi:ATP-dependent Lon protease